MSAPAASAPRPGAPAAPHRRYGGTSEVPGRAEAGEDLAPHRQVPLRNVPRQATASTANEPPRSTLWSGPKKTSEYSRYGNGAKPG